MTVQRLEHIGIVVDDLAAPTAFFAARGRSAVLRRLLRVALAPRQSRSRGMLIEIGVGLMVLA